jgi:hypothetical protein
VKVTVQRKFKINGVEYTSIDQVPPQYRDAINRAMEKKAFTAVRWVVVAIGLAIAIGLMLLRFHL